MVLSKTGVILLIVFGVIFVLSAIIIPSVLIPLFLSHQNGSYSSSFHSSNESSNESSSSSESSSESNSSSESSSSAPLDICVKTNTVSGLTAIGDIGEINPNRRSSALCLAFPSGDGEINLIVPGQDGTLREGRRIVSILEYSFSEMVVPNLSIQYIGQTSLSEDGLSIVFTDGMFVYIASRENPNSSLWETTALKENPLTGFSNVCISGNGTTIIVSSITIELESEWNSNIFVFERNGSTFSQTKFVPFPPPTSFLIGNCLCINRQSTRCVIISKSLDTSDTIALVGYRDSISDTWKGLDSGLWLILPGFSGSLINSTKATLYDNESEGGLGAMLFMLTPQYLYVFHILSTEYIIPVDGTPIQNREFIDNSITVSGVNCVQDLFTSGPSDNILAYIARYRYVKEMHRFERQDNMFYNIYDTPRASIAMYCSSNGEYLSIVTSPPDSSTLPNTAFLLKICPEVPDLEFFGYGQVNEGIQTEWQALSCIVFADGNRTLVLNEENTVSEGVYDTIGSLYMYNSINIVPEVPYKVMSSSYGKISFSDDGTKFVFVDSNTPGTVFACLRDDISDTSWRISTVATSPEQDSPWVYVSISGTGNMVACLRNFTSESVPCSEIVFFQYSVPDFEYVASYQYSDTIALSVAFDKRGFLCFMTSQINPGTLNMGLAGSAFAFISSWNPDIILQPLYGLSGDPTQDPRISIVVDTSYETDSPSVYPMFFLALKPQIYAFYFNRYEVYRIPGSPLMGPDGDDGFGESIAFSNIGCSNTLHIGSSSQNKVYRYVFDQWSIVPDGLLEFPNTPATTSRGSSIYTTSSGSHLITTSQLLGVIYPYVFST